MVDKPKNQAKMVQQWKVFSKQEAYQDLIEYVESQREMFRQYAEDRAMPHPLGEGIVYLDNETVAALLQNSRGLNIVKTYIELRVNATDVAQSTSNK